MSAADAHVLAGFVRQVEGVEDAPGWSHREAAPILLVLADALAERGYIDLAEDLSAYAERIGAGRYISDVSAIRRRVGQAIARIRHDRPVPEQRARRRERLYRYYRRRGLRATRAMSLARRAENIGRVVAVIGEGARDWPFTTEDDAEAIIREPDGTYSMEHLEMVDEGRHFLLYRVPLEREAVPDWIRVRDLVAFWGMSPSVFRRRWRSRDPREQAETRAMTARYYGWPNFDAYPIRLSQREVELRYRRRRR